MTNEKIKNIINEEIAAAQLHENVFVEVTFHGNSAFLMAFSRHLFNQSYTVTRGNVTTTKQNTHYEVSRIGFGGEKVWGIQGEQRIREVLRRYLTYVGA